MLLACGVEKESGGGAVGVEFLDGRVRIADFRDFYWTGARDAFGVVVEDGAEFWAACFAKEEEMKFHGNSPGREKPQRRPRRSAAATETNARWRCKTASTKEFRFVIVGRISCVFRGGFCG